MLSGISIICFAASYTISLALEATRLWFRSSVRSVAMVGFNTAGLIAHSLFLVYRASTSQGPPLSTSFDWYLVAAWVLAVFSTYMTLSHPKAMGGLFILPIVLALLVMAEFFADDVPFPVSQAAHWWGVMHGAFWLAGTVAVTVGFVAGIMYLIQARRLKLKRALSSRLQLPSLEWLEKLNIRSTRISAVLLLLGFLGALVLNATRHPDTVPWSDPIVWSTAPVVIWVVAATIFGLTYRPARMGRKVAYLTICSFVLLSISLCASLLLPTQHGTNGAADNARQVGEMIQ